MKAKKKVEFLFYYVKTVPGSTVRSCHGLTSVKLDPPLRLFFAIIKSALRIEL